MLTRFTSLLLVITLFACQEPTNQNNTVDRDWPEVQLKQYPKTAEVDVVDDYFGTQVPDPYRWLEDDLSAETEEWVKNQNEVTFDYLKQIPFRKSIENRLTELWNYPRNGTPFKEGDHFFMFKNDGLQNQSVLYIMDDLKSDPKVFLDPNKLSKDGTTSITAIQVSNDGKYFGYGLAKGGSDWQEFHVKDIETGEDLPDVLNWVKFSGMAWYKDGFYYSRYDAPNEGSELSNKNEYHKVYYHKLGTDQSKDKLVFEDKEHPLRNFGAIVTEDEKYLLLIASEGTSGNMLFYKDLSKPKSTFVNIVNDFENDHDVIDNIGDKILLLTNLGAPKRKVVLVDPSNPKPENWEVLIPEKEEVLEGIVLAGGKLIAAYLKDAKSTAFIHDLQGNPEGKMKLPGIGSLGSMNGKKDEDLLLYSFSSFTFPSNVYKYSVSENKSEILFDSKVDFDDSKYETKQVFYKSKDGTEIPMFLTYKKGIELNGKNPTLLYGYGGFNISITPHFRTSNLILLENGGIYAVANIRGGGEYGEEWHKAGTKLQKQNVFDDFIAAAEYLIEKKYTSSEYLAISGRSNGGLLVGACMTQRPDLFEVAFPGVGVLDMLRFHKFTIGWAWTVDYGSSENEDEFQALHAYSPLHNIKEGVEYPATMVITADHDDRVVPAHSFKFISELQKKHKGKNPVLIRIETMAGHGAGKPTSKKIEEAADLWAFMFYNMEIWPKYEMKAEQPATEGM